MELFYSLLNQKNAKLADEVKLASNWLKRVFTGEADARTYKKVVDYIISKGNLKATCEIRREPIKGLGFIPQFFKSIGDTRIYNFTKDHDYCS